MSKSKSAKNNNTGDKRTDPAIIVAIIGLIGTVIAALLGGPVIELIRNRSSQTLLPPTTSAALFQPTSTLYPTSTANSFSGCPSEMAAIPAGYFWMGATPNDQQAQDDEKPQRKIYLDAFCVDKTEVSNQQYYDLLGQTPPPNTIPDLPVVNVTWNDASDFCKTMGDSLPTEAQWEKAARGKNAWIYPWGNNWDPNLANHGGTLPRELRAVTDYPEGASPYGVLNMAGNAAEWVADWYESDWYNKIPNDYPNPFEEIPKATRVARGGSFVDSNINLRTSSREGTYYPDDKFDYLGFRCAAVLRIP
jgi:formylglycine-generating enzyme required for sulfatase activity